jgi:hypothetical protein
MKAAEKLSATLLWKPNMPIEIKRMWEGGPLRQWSDTRQTSGGWLYYTNSQMTGYAGSYVCDECRQSTPGVYYVSSVKKWLCRACKKLAKSSKQAKAAD